MKIIFEKKINGEEAIKEVGSLFDHISGIRLSHVPPNPIQDDVIEKWDNHLKEVVCKLFENSNEILTKLYHGKTFGIFPLEKMVLPDAYREARKQRNKDNQELFNHQSKVLIEIKDAIESNDFKDSLKELRCGDLFFDIDKNELKYKNNKPIPLKNNQDVKILKLLMKNKNKIVGYDVILREISPNKYNKILLEEEIDKNRIQEHIKLYDKDSIYHLKSKVRKLLKKVGMTVEDIDKIIVNKGKAGYMIVCEDR